MPDGMTGSEFLRLLIRLDREELRLPIATLVDLYDGPTCNDCGAVGHSVYEALACDGFADARRRKEAARFARRVDRHVADLSADPEGSVASL